MATKAATLPVPKDLQLKAPKDFTIVRTSKKCRRAKDRHREAGFWTGLPGGWHADRDDPAPAGIWNETKIL